MKLPKNIKFFLRYFLGPILFILLSWNIYKSILSQPDLESVWTIILEASSGKEIWKLIAVFLLMLLNWSIEAIKWQRVVQIIQPVSFYNSFRAVLSGISFSVNMPNRIGEYFGRVLYLTEGNRLKAVSLTIVASISQLLVTLLFGLVGLLLLKDNLLSAGVIPPALFTGIFFVTVLVLLVGFIFFFKINWLSKLLRKIPRIEKFQFLFTTLEELHAVILLRLLSLSLIRFLVFIVQYGLLFNFFGVELNILQLFGSMTLYFFSMAIIPSFAIAELPVRGTMSLWLVGLFSANKAGIVFATLCIWLINLIVPAIAGAILLLGNKKMTD